MTIPVFQVDAFTDRPFRGNPAAVCILDKPPAEAWMQDVAREMNLPETAYLLPDEDGFGLRWFTPKTEVDLCGHATLASAHVLWETERLPLDRSAVFHTRSGVLTAEMAGEWIEMDFPAEPGRPLSGEESMSRVEEALGAKAENFAVNRFDYLVEVNSEESLRSLRPDFNSLARLPPRGVIVTCLSETGGFDFMSRFFAPAAGIEEDPVTGSAHCFLGPYWSAQLKKDEFTAFQASERGGVVRIHLRGDRVVLGGKAVMTIEGTIEV